MQPDPKSGADILNLPGTLKMIHRVYPTSPPTIDVVIASDGQGSSTPIPMQPVITAQTEHGLASLLSVNSSDALRIDDSRIHTDLGFIVLILLVMLFFQVLTLPPLRKK